MFVVGFDQEPGVAAKGKEAMHCRSAIYRAITRAIMYVVIINDLLQGGMLEFLGSMELEKGVKLEASKERARINQSAARELMLNAQVVEKATVQAQNKANRTKENVKSEHKEESPNDAKVGHDMNKAAKTEKAKVKTKRSNNVWDTTANSAQVHIVIIPPSANVPHT